MGYIFTLILIGILAYFIWAYKSDNKLWADKSEQELKDMALGDDWRAWSPSLLELKTRGISVEMYRSQLIGNLSGGTAQRREGARQALLKVYGDMKESLENYKAMTETDATKKIVESLLKEYS